MGGSALPIRFYAGAPLITSTGHRIGAMCAVLHVHHCGWLQPCLSEAHACTGGWRGPCVSQKAGVCFGSGEASSVAVLQRVEARVTDRTVGSAHLRCLAEGTVPRRCLVDTQPRRLSVDDYRVLNNCAEMVVRRLEREVFAREHMGAAHQVRLLWRPWRVRNMRSRTIITRPSGAVGSQGANGRRPLGAPAVAPVGGAHQLQTYAARCPSPVGLGHL